MMGRKVTMKVMLGAMIVLLAGSYSLGQTTTAAAKGGILSAVPSDAWVAVVFNNLDQSGKMIDSYAAKLGAQSPNVQKKLGRMMGGSGQVDMTQPMVLVVMRKDLYGEQPIALVASVKEFEKFAADLKGQTTETPGLMKGRNEELGDVYFGKKGPFVVLGPTEAIVKAVVESKEGFEGSMDASSSKLMNQSDIYARVNVQSLGQFIQPALMGFGAMMQMSAMGGMEGMGGEEGEDAQKSEKNKVQMQAMQAAGAVINALVGFISETNSLDLGVKFDPELVRAGFAMTFKPGQEMATMLASQKQTDKPLIKGVAGNGFALAAGWQWEPKITKIQEAILQINPGFTNPADAETYKNINRSLVMLNQGQSIKLAVRSAKPGEPMFEFQQVTQTKDAKKFMEQTRQLMELQGKMSGMGSGADVKFQYEAGVAKIEGVTVDRVTIDLNSLFNMPGMTDPQMSQVKGIISALLGSSDNLIRLMMAPVGDKVVVTMFGGDEKSMGALIKSAQGGETPLAKDAKVAQVAKLLPKTRLMEGYFDFGKLATGCMTMMMASGENKAEGESAATFPAIETPLVGATGSVEGSSFKVDMVIPFEVISNLSNLRYMLPTMPGMDGMDTNGLSEEEGEVSKAPATQEEDSDTGDEEESGSGDEE